MESDGSALGKARVSGVRIILVMTLLAFAAAIFAVVFHHMAGRRARAWWGSEQAMIVRDAPLVQLLVLEPEPTPDPAPTPENVRPGLPEGMRVAEIRDVSSASGILHVREQLLKDNSYRWSAAPVPTPPPTQDGAPPDRGRLRKTSVESRWQFALRFLDAERQVVVWFDLDRHRLRTATNDEPLSFEPIAPFIEKFLERYR